MSERQLEGIWWLPETPDQRAAGVLSIQEDGRAQLSLIGSLRSYLDGAEEQEGADGVRIYSFSDEGMERNGIYPRILGQVGNKGVTLDDCFQTFQSSDPFGTFASERIHVHRIYEGAFFPSEETPRFFQATVNIAGLAHWVVKTGIDESLSFREKSDGGVEDLTHEVKIAKLPDDDFRGLNDQTYSIRHTYRISGDRTVEISFEQDFCIVLRSDTDLSTDDFLWMASFLQDLVTIGTGRIAELSSVEFQHSELFAERGGRKLYTPIQFTAQWMVRSPKYSRKLQRSDLFFTLEDFGGSQTITNWLKVSAANDSVLARVMSTVYGQNMYVTDSFFSCAVSLERYDRDKHRDTDKQRKSRSEVIYIDRLLRCAEHAGAEFEKLVGNVPLWAKSVRDARNAVAHHNAGIAEASTEQIVLGQSAYWLFVLCLLKDAEVPMIVTSKISEHPRFKRLANDVAALLATK